ncbi:hypothetical protein [Lysobacter sp. CA199]|uniref:hypothetical protein n=1 Tax=Lysobacter sp. CA199 TaxID=3455608 RepID=UPI003F8D8B7C
MNQAIEITTFKLTKGRSAADFIAANAQVDPWLQRQPGFISRIMIEQAGGGIMDLVIWERPRQAEDAARRLMIELKDAAVHDAIDQRTVSWSVASIIHRLGQQS